MNKIGLIDEIAPRYRSTYFAHIFSGGYSSGYYSYIHSAVLDSDAFGAFKEVGDIFDPALSTKLRKHIYEKGSTEDAMDLYVNFRGRKPIIAPLLTASKVGANPAAPTIAAITNSEGHAPASCKASGPAADLIPVPLKAVFNSL